MRNALFIKDLRTILGFKGGGGAAILQLSREDKICAIFFFARISYHISRTAGRTYFRKIGNFEKAT